MIYDDPQVNIMLDMILVELTPSQLGIYDLYDITIWWYCDTIIWNYYHMFSF